MEIIMGTAYLLYWKEKTEFDESGRHVNIHLFLGMQISGSVNIFAIAVQLILFKTTSFFMRPYL
jgi:hypothetical protein